MDGLVGSAAVFFMVFSSLFRHYVQTRQADGACG
jgi:hypothetical protein